ncbi:MAG: hypothetical protein N2690_00265 [Rhodocyclaceae bacterium]|nr:hypothetical protein [Rhodocyclaceae bacterium]
MKHLKFGGLLVWALYSGWACAQAQAASSNASPSPPPALVDQLARISQFEQKQELMRKEMELMRTQIEFLRLQRDFERQVDDLRLPSVVATWGQGAQAQALLRDEQGLTMQVALHQTIAPSVRVVRINEMGVWVEIERRSGKKRRTEEVMLKAALPASMQAPAASLPSSMPAMPPLPARLP